MALKLRITNVQSATISKAKADLRFVQGDAVVNVTAEVFNDVDNTVVAGPITRTFARDYAQAAVIRDLVGEFRAQREAAQAASALNAGTVADAA